MILRLFLVVFCVSVGCSRTKERFDKASAALGCVLNFINNDKANMNVDGLFGVVLAKGQLAMALQLPLGPREKDMVEKLEKKCSYLLKNTQPVMPVDNGIYRKIKSHLMDPNIWMVNNSYDSTLMKMVPFNWSTEDFKYYMFHGQPDEVKSDSCVNQLVDASWNEEHKCLISQDCENIMDNLDDSNGYPLSHKLLLLQTARALKCRLDPIELSLKTHYLCSRILKESRTIEAIHYPFFGRDLFIEQSVLCGLEGFTQFLPGRWLDVILDWKSDKCCYSLRPPKFQHRPTRWRNKRESFKMSYGCDNHITGLATAAIAIHMKYLLSQMVI